MALKVWQNIRAISLKFLLFCCFNFDPKISANAFIWFIILFLYDSMELKLKNLCGKGHAASA